MKVFFDVSHACFLSGGIPVYIHSLSQALQKLCRLRGDHLVVSQLSRVLRPGRSSVWQRKLKSFVWNTYYLHYLLASRARVEKADLLHVPDVRSPIRHMIPVVMTIYDVTPLLFPKLFRYKDAVLMTMYLRLSVKHVDHIVTISERSRKDIHEFLKVGLNQISVTYPGVSSIFTRLELQEQQNVLQTLCITKPYILSIGNIESRKNLKRVLDAFADLKRKFSIQHNLVLVGKPGPHAQSILAHAQHLGIEQSVQYTGFVPDQYLPALYSGASVFVYPSLYEGFGIPPLEAMACGCPVVTSHSSSLPEVVGDAAILVDPYHIEQIEAAIMCVIEDRHLSETMSQKGLARAQMFSWERCAEETLAVYQRVLHT